MNRRRVGWILLLIGTTLLCGVGIIIFNFVRCPNLDTIETIIPEDAVVEITMSRTICFGTCPSYTLHIDGNGHIYYDGGNHTTLQGPHEAQMTETNHNRLIQAFEKYNFKRLVTEYEYIHHPYCSENPFAFYTDAPNVILGISVNGRLTEVDHYHGDTEAPLELKELENLVDELTGSNRWVK